MYTLSLTFTHMHPYMYTLSLKYTGLDSILFIPSMPCLPVSYLALTGAQLSLCLSLFCLSLSACLSSFSFHNLFNTLWPIWSFLFFSSSKILSLFPDMCISASPTLPHPSLQLFCQLSSPFIEKNQFPKISKSFVCWRLLRCKSCCQVQKKQKLDFLAAKKWCQKI